MSDIQIVAELGQNHNGSVEIARNLCEIAARPKRYDRRSEEKHAPRGADAIKLCKRDLSQELSREQAQSGYHGRHSFGDTYIEHRRSLELDWQQIEDVVGFARDRRLGVGITLCSHTLVGEAEDVAEFDFYKVASRDLTNLPLLRALTDTDKPIVISTGMATEEDLEAAAEILAERDRVTVCGCTSSYPCRWKDVNLRQLAWLHEWIEGRGFDWNVGFSDHTKGVQAGVAAVAFGISYYEGHLTLARGMHGSDHAASKGPSGWWRICRDIRNVETGLGEYGLVVPASVESARQKLERRVASAEALESGTVLGSSNTVPLSGESATDVDAVSWREGTERLFGRQVVGDVEPQTLLSSTMVAGE